MARTTLAAINAQLPDGVTLVKGRGYFYFYGDEPNQWNQSGVYVYRLNDMNIGGWIDTFKAMRKENA